MNIPDHELLTALVHTSPIGMCILDAGTLTIEMNNAAYLEVAGKTKEQTIGHYFWDVFPEVKNMFAEDMDNALAGKAVRGKEIAVPLIRFGKLEHIYINFEYSPIKNNEGVVSKIVVWVMDLTSQVSQQQQIEVLNGELAASNEEYVSINEELTASNEELLQAQEEHRVASLLLEQKTQQLSESEHRFKSMIHSASVAFLLLKGEDLIVEEINRPMLNIFAKDSAAVIGKPLLSIFPELTGQPILNAIYDTYQTGNINAISEMPATIIRDGNQILGYYNISYTPIYENGHITGVMESATDVTEQVDTREKLHKLNSDLQGLNNNLILSQRLAESKEERLNQFIMQAPAGMALLTGENLIYRLCNPPYIDFLPGRDLLGFSIFDVMPELKGTFVEKAIRGVYETGKAFSAIEEHVPLIDKETGEVEQRYFNFNYIPLRNELGEIDSILNFAYEVTDQVLARKKVEDAENQLRLAIEAAGLGSWHIDPTTKALEYNDELAKIFGYEGENAMSYDQAIAQVVDEDRPRILAAIEKAITQGGNYDITYSQRRFNDNQVIWLRSLGKISKDKNGEHSIFAGVVMDITEQKIDEQRKNDFIGMVSHELKTPITSINAYLQVLQRKSKLAEDNYSLNTLNKSVLQVRKMTNMVNGFLNLSRLESGKIHIESQHFDMAILLKDAQDEALSTISTHRLIFPIIPETFVTADRDKINTVLNNLITNAVKYSPVGSEITIECLNIGGVIQVSVRDTGEGIAKEDLDRLFERYYRTEKAITSSTSGFGIGLYLSNEIIQRHSGRIWVESEVGIGSTFYFTLNRN